MADFSAWSDSDLEAYASGDISKMSDAALESLAASQGSSYQSASTRTAQRRGEDVSPDDSFSQYMSRMAYGIREPISGAAQLVRRAVPEPVRELGDAADRWLYENTGGFLGARDFDKAIQADYENYQQNVPPGMGFDHARLLGNLGLDVAAMGRFPLGSTIPRAAGLGATGGAIGGASMPVTDPQQLENFAATKAQQAGSGALFGAPVGAASRFGVNVLSPRAPLPEVLRLEDYGIDPTMMSRGSDMTRTLEQQLQSTPFAGTAIRQARERARDQFNQAAVAQITSTIPGEIAEDTVPEALVHAKRFVDNAYENAADMARGFRLDQQAGSEFQNYLSMLDSIDPSQARIVRRFWDDRVASKFNNIGGITSESYKQLDSQLNKIIAATKEPQTQEAFREMQRILRNAAGRQVPEMAQAYRNADIAYRRLLVMQDAATRSTDDFFTPKQLLQAIKKQDVTRNKGRFSRQEADLQQFALDAQKILGDTYPDSGTAGRGLTILAATVADATLPAKIAAAYIAAKGLNNPRTQRLLRYLVRQRPDVLRELQPAMESLGAAGAAAAGQEVNRAGSM